MVALRAHSGPSEGLTLHDGDWIVHPDTGMISLTEEAMKNIVNKDSIDKWYIIDPEPIARGQFAAVYHVRHRVSGEEYAAKYASRWRLGVDCTGDIVHEIAVCALLRHHDRTVQLVDVFSTDNSLVLVMEYAAGGDLQTLLDEDLVPYERDVISFTRQLLEGLVGIHDLGIVHLDIKPQNLVLMGEFPACAVKLCDFEISRMLTPGHDVREVLGTPDYVAPEILLYDPITTKTDMWSLGVLTYVLLTGFLPFGGDTDQETFLEISRAELDFPEELFEDISAQAIDFIKSLVVKTPGSRLSAHDCLEHPWMKADMSKPKIPPQILVKIMSPIASPLSTSPFNPPTFNSTHMSSPINIINPPMFPMTSTPAIMTPINTTPTIMTPMSGSPRNIGLPPIHPLSSQRSVGQSSSIHSSTTSLYRVGSRQNLDRLRSMSKSREVLTERLYKSNYKKKMSRSKERLTDGRYSLFSSREKLGSLSSLLQTYEGYPVSNWLNQDNSIYDSSNSVYQPQLPMLEENISGRHYRSWSNIDKIDECCSQLSKKYIYNSRLSINDEFYNNSITNHNNKMSCSPKRKGRRNRENPQNIQDTHNRQRKRKTNNKNTGSCSKNCSRHHHHTEPPKTNPVNRPEKVNQNIGKRPKVKEKPKEKQESLIIEPKRKTSDPEAQRAKEKRLAQARGSTPVKRRGSVSHVEQRIQERHDRQQEKQLLEKKVKLERRASMPKNLLSTRRKDSLEEKEKEKAIQLDRNKKNIDKSKNTNIGIQRSRSVSPCKCPKPIKKKQPSSTNASPASSLESVKEISDIKRVNVKREKNREFNKVVKSGNKRHHSSSAKLEKKSDVDEAYVSLEEHIDDGIFSRSESMDSTMTMESDLTLKAINSSSDSLESTLVTLHITDIDKSQESVVIPEILTNIHRKNIKNNVEPPKNTTEDVAAENIAELTVITEEEEEALKGSWFARSVSTSSDIGSMVSESSEGDKDNNSDTKSQQSDVAASKNWKIRGRSMSIQPGSTFAIDHKRLTRSTSVNSVLSLPCTLNSIAMPWVEMCEGSVGRAIESFKLAPKDMTLAGRILLTRQKTFHN
ncbi:unnamed protein product, partial [Meganyctiphanes norvegica]